ncbi:DUF655 domain-containing protein [Candidatus Pacearchaeota archaeon]|nr:DUF655 domain-containing protein [Candidatus Pacearchaeota archaeon]
MTIKEEHAIILDFLPYGYPLEGKRVPIAQAIGINNFILLQLVPRKETVLEIKERVYIGEGKRDKIYYILGRLPREKLTETAKNQLREFIDNTVDENEQKFVEFFNTCQPINTRLHQLELLPGMGKKHTREIIEEKKNGEFKSFEDMKKRLPHLPDPKTAIKKRIYEELTELQRHNLFIK